MNNFKFSLKGKKLQLPKEVKNENQKRSHNDLRSSYKGRRANALALGAEEGRDKLR